MPGKYCKKQQSGFHCCFFVFRLSTSSSAENQDYRVTIMYGEINVVNLKIIQSMLKGC